MPFYKISGYYSGKKSDNDEYEHVFISDKILATDRYTAESYMLSMLIRNRGDIVGYWLNPPLVHRVNKCTAANS